MHIRLTLTAIATGTALLFSPALAGGPAGKPTREKQADGSVVWSVRCR